MAQDIRLGSYLIDTPIEEILYRLKAEVKNGKLKEIRNNNDEIRVTCPFHSGGMEKHASCNIYIGEEKKDVPYGCFNCFTCGHKGLFWDFIAGVTGWSVSESKEWLISTYGKLFSVQSLNLQPIVLNAPQEKIQPRNIDLSLFSDYHPYMKKRKLSEEVIKKFSIKYDPMTQCIVFPVWDEDNNLVMCTRRSVNTKQFIIDKNCVKPVYLYNYVKEKKIPYAFVVESQINALYLHSLGFSAVATFGCNITKEQFDILNHSGIRNFIIAFDGDAAGRKGTVKFLENIRGDIFVDILTLPDFKDVNDLSEQELLDLMAQQDIDYVELRKIYELKTKN